MRTLAITSLSLLPASLALPRSILMRNAADPGMEYPVMGLGTAGGLNSNVYGAYPECWASCSDGECLQPLPTGGCGEYVHAAIVTFLQLGGLRVDSADSYRNQDAVGRAVNSVPRDRVFFQTKVGSYLPMGYNETWNQTRVILDTTNLTYIDQLMLHWPSCSTGGGCGPSTDPACDWGAPTYNDTACRLSTWQALLDVWRAGLARSVGVSNFNISHLEEIRAAGMTLPSLNQVSFHLYHSVAEKELLSYCAANGIIFNGWVPFARSDSWLQQPPCAPTPVQDATAAALAVKYNVTPAQVQLAWQVQVGVAVNPRSQNAAHMMENLNIFDIQLAPEDMQLLWDMPQSICEPPACTNPVTSGCVNNGK